MDSFIAALCVFACLCGGAAEKVRSHVRSRRKQRRKSEIEGVICTQPQGGEEGWTEIAGTVEAQHSKNGSRTHYDINLWHRPLDDDGAK